MVQGSGDTAEQPTGVTSPNDGQIYGAVRNWLLSTLPSCVQVVQGQQNRVAPPLAPFITMTLVERTRLATNSWSYTPTTREVREPVRVGVQLGVFGSGAGGYAQTISAYHKQFYNTLLGAADAQRNTALFARAVAA